MDGTDGRIYEALSKSFAGIVRAKKGAGSKAPWKMKDVNLEAIFSKLVIT
jgi:hypothetical protein